MKYSFVMKDGQVLTEKGHNNRAPGLLRVYITGDVAKLGKKMSEVKNDKVFQEKISTFMIKPVESLAFRFNKNLGKNGAGILVQDATQKFQSATADEIIVTIDSEIAITTSEAPVAPVAEIPEQPVQ